MHSDTPDVGRLYQEHGAEILNYLARRCPEQAAQDLLQETFLQAVRATDRLEHVTMPRAWLFGIARRILALHFRRRKNEHDNVEPPLDTLVVPEPIADTPATEDARLPAMRSAIAQLPPELRETLGLRLTEELSYEEIAVVLGIPVGTVRSRLHNAVRRLRATLTHPDTTPVL